MTGEERIDFKALREEMREGFRDVTAALGRLAERVDSLEGTRDRQAGADEAREKLLVGSRSAFMWKIGITVSVLATAAGILVNLLTRLIEKGTL